jgi:hypothetical protein
MQRRDLINSMVAGGAIAAVGRRAHAVPQGWREFEITYVITLKDATALAQLWVPVPQDALDYQRLVDLGWRSSVPAYVVWEGTSRTHRLGGVAGTDDPARRDNHRPGDDVRPVRLLS